MSAALKRSCPVLTIKMSVVFSSMSRMPDSNIDVSGSICLHHAVKWSMLDSPSTTQQ